MNALLVRLRAERKMRSDALKRQRAAWHSARSAEMDALRQELGLTAYEEKRLAAKVRKERLRRLADTGLQPTTRDADLTDPLIRVSVVGTMLGRGIGKLRNGDDWEWGRLYDVLDEMEDEDHPLAAALGAVVEWVVEQLPGSDAAG